MSNPSFSGVSSFEILCQGRAFPLSYGASLTQAELPMLAPAAVGGPVAQVSANPNDPSQLGLQNLTAYPWVALMPDGSQQQVDPGRSARLMDGVTLQMAGTQCQIRAAQASPFGQTQAPAFGQTQAPAFGQTQAPAFGQTQAPAFGQTQNGGAWPPPPVSGAAGGWVNAGANDSGTGSTAVLPPQLRGFNVGAFLLNWIWAIANKTWIGLLCFIPYVGVVMAFVLGFKGNEWAWQNRRWDSIEQFQLVQKKWTTGSIIYLGVSIVLGILYVVVMGVLVAHSPQPAQQPVTP